MFITGEKKFVEIAFTNFQQCLILNFIIHKQVYVSSALEDEEMGWT